MFCSSLSTVYLRLRYIAEIIHLDSKWRWFFCPVTLVLLLLTHPLASFYCKRTPAAERSAFLHAATMTRIQPCTCWDGYIYGLWPQRLSTVSVWQSSVFSLGSRCWQPIMCVCVCVQTVWPGVCLVTGSVSRSWCHLVTCPHALSLSLSLPEERRWSEEN